LREAVTVVDPAAEAVATPAPLTDAIEPEATLHVAVELTFAVEPSLYVAVAVNCCVCPDWRLTLAGDTAKDDNVFELAVTPWQPIPAIVKATVEVVAIEKNTRRRVAFISSLHFYSGKNGTFQGKRSLVLNML
jgi:hypothetical protein